MIVGRWCVQLAAIWHWYLPLCIYKKYVFLPYILFFNLVFINQIKWSTIPACPSFVCIFKKVSIEGTNSENVWVIFVHLCLF